jgi:hypothetical protein
MPLVIRIAIFTRYLFSVGYGHYLSWRLGNKQPGFGPLYFQNLQPPRFPLELPDDPIPARRP